MTKSITRRTLVRAVPAAGLVAMATPAIVRAAALGSRPPHFTGRNGYIELVAANTTIPSFTVAPGSGPTGFPGQAGNPVGYSAPASGYIGTLTPYTGPWTANASYSQLLVDVGTAPPVSINAGGVTLTGCYFGSAYQNSNSVVAYSGSGHAPISHYCTFGPSPSAYGSFPPLPPGGGGYTNWPSRNDNAGINFLDCAQYGPFTRQNTPTGGLQFYFCDLWGFANGFLMGNTSTALGNPCTYDNCWIHDPQLEGGQHIDGIGYINAPAVTISNLTVNHCTIAFVSNTESIAMQVFTACQMQNNTYQNNYIAGTPLTIGAYPGNTPSPFTGQVFINNTIGSSCAYESGKGIMFNASSAPFNIPGSGNQWRNNTCLQDGNGGNFGTNGVVPTGFFLWPDNTTHATDWSGAF